MLMTDLLMNDDTNFKVKMRNIYPDAPMKIDLKKYMGRGEKMFHTDAQEYIREMREHQHCQKNSSDIRVLKPWIVYSLPLPASPRRKKLCLDNPNVS